MLFPLAGLLMFFIPAAGVILALICRLSPHRRHLTLYALLIPVSASYGALLGLFGTLYLVEIVGVRLQVVSWLAGWVGLFTGGALGVVAGVGIVALLRTILRHGETNSP